MAICSSPKPFACNAEGREIRRGILRDFPTTYTAKDGRRVRVGFTVLSVTRDGQPEKFTNEALSNGVRDPHRQRRSAGLDRPAHLCDPVSHHAAGRLLR